MTENSQKEAILHAIKYRRSIFPASYTRQEISKETILQLLDAANAAPNHKLTQPWQFTVFRGAGLSRLADKMAALYKEQTPSEQFLQKKHEIIKDKIKQSAAVIAIQIRYSGLVPRWEEVAAVGCAVQNLWLAAEANNIGGYWSSPATRTGLHDLLGIAEEDEECLGLFYLGYHHETKREGLRKPVAEKTSWIES